MIVTIHQPEHLPWTGFFNKMAHADIYVLLDNVQFKKNNWQNRNRIVDAGGAKQWLTVPVQIKGHTSSCIKETQILVDQPWQRKYLGRVDNAYRRHPHFPAYRARLGEIINAPIANLVDLNIALIEFFRDVLVIRTDMRRASDLPVDGASTDLLVSICRHLGGDCYLSGSDGRNYLDFDTFERNGITVRFHDFTPPSYAAANFVQGLSTLDLLMNHGVESRNVIEI